MIYGVHIVTAHPDHKRPYANAYVEYFKSIEECNEYRRKEKIKYYKGFQEYLREEGLDVPKDIDNLDEDKADDYIFSDSYMDMPPFDATLYEITLNENEVKSKIIEFPLNDKIEGC